MMYQTNTIGYYGDEFSPEQRKKILAAITDSWRRKEAAQDA
jgi:hypothetical protein